MKYLNNLLNSNKNLWSFCFVISKSYCYITNKKQKFACVDVNKFVFSRKNLWYFSLLQPSAQKINYTSPLQPSAQNINQTENLIYVNKSFNKAQLRVLLQWAFQTIGSKRTIDLVEQLKKTGYDYATRAGISLTIDDLQIPPTKGELLITTQNALQSAYEEVEQGNLTSLEYSSQIIERWNATSEQLKQEVIAHFKSKDILNPVYMMAFSGARGNIAQVRQLTGMRGLMSDPTGQIIEFPIQSNFREGLTLTEYLISCYGARKGVVDTALRTATSGYLTRRLVDAAHHVMVRVEDCGTKKGIVLSELRFGAKGVYGLNKRLIGRVLAKAVYHNGVKLASSNQAIHIVLANKLSQLQQPILVRSPMTCDQNRFICQHCYGWNLGTSALVSLGESVGVIAAQSIGEPGTQLTMRTFHTGGVFSGDVAEQLKSPGFGQIHFPSSIPGCCVRTTQGQIAFLTKQTACFFLCNALTKKPLYTIRLPSYSLLFVKQGQHITENDVIAELFVTQKLAQNQSRTIFQMLYSNYSGELRFPTGEILQALPQNTISSQRTYFPTAPITLERNNFWILASHRQRFLAGLAPGLVQPGDLIDINAPLSGYEQTKPLHCSSLESSLPLPVAKTKIDWQSKKMPMGEWLHYFVFFHWKIKQKQKKFNQKIATIFFPSASRKTSKKSKKSRERKVAKKKANIKSLFNCFTMIQGTSALGSFKVTKKKNVTKKYHRSSIYSSVFLKPIYDTLTDFKGFNFVSTNSSHCVGLSPTSLCQFYAFNETKRYLVISFSRFQPYLQIQMTASLSQLNQISKNKAFRLNALKKNKITVYQPVKSKQECNLKLLFFAKWLHRFEAAWQLNSIISLIDLKKFRKTLIHQPSNKYQSWLWKWLINYEGIKSISNWLKQSHFKNQQNARQTLHIYWPIKQQFKFTQTIEPLTPCVEKKLMHLTTSRCLKALAWLHLGKTKNDTTSLFPLVLPEGLQNQREKVHHKNKPKLTSKQKLKKKDKLKNKPKLKRSGKTAKKQNINLLKIQYKPIKLMKKQKTPVTQKSSTNLFSLVSKPKENKRQNKNKVKKLKFKKLLNSKNLQNSTKIDTHCVKQNISQLSSSLITTNTIIPFAFAKSKKTKEQIIELNLPKKVQHQITIQTSSKKPKIKLAKKTKVTKSTFAFDFANLQAKQKVKETKSVKTTKTLKATKAKTKGKKNAKNKDKMKIKTKSKLKVLQTKNPKTIQQPIIIKQTVLIKQLVHWQIHQICQNPTPNLCIYFFMCNYITYEAEFQRFSIWLKWYKQQNQAHHQLGLTLNSIQIPLTMSIIDFLKRKQNIYQINYVDFPWLNLFVQSKHKNQQLFQTRFGLTDHISTKKDYRLQNMTFYDPARLQELFKKQIYFVNRGSTLLTNSKFYQTYPKEGKKFFNTWLCSNQAICALNKNQHKLSLKSDWLITKNKSWLNLIQICPWFGFSQNKNKQLPWFSQTQRKLQNLRQTIQTNVITCNQNFVYFSARVLFGSCMKNNKNKFLTDYSSIDLVRAQYEDYQPSFRQTPLFNINNKLTFLKSTATTNKNKPLGFLTLAHLISFYGWLQIIPYAEVCTDNHNKIGLEGRHTFDQHMTLKRFFYQNKTPFYKATYDDNWLVWSLTLQKKLLRLDLPITQLCSKTPIFVPYLSVFFKQFIQKPFKLYQLTPTDDFSTFVFGFNFQAKKKETKLKSEIICSDFYVSVFDFYAHNIGLKKHSLFLSQSSKKSLMTVISKTKQTNKQLPLGTVKRLKKKLENVSFYYRLVFLKQASLPYVQTNKHKLSQQVKNVVSDLRPIILKPNKIYWNAISRYKPSLLVDALCFKANKKIQTQAVAPILHQRKSGLPIIKKFPTLTKNQLGSYCYSLKEKIGSDLKTCHLQVLFRQKGIIQVVQKATQLYTVCSNPKKIAAFSLGLEKTQKSYTTLTNEFQLTKSVKNYDPFYSTSFFSKSFKSDQLNWSTKIITNKKSSGSTKTFPPKSGFPFASKASFTNLRTKGVKKNVLFPSSLFWVRYRYMCVKEKLQMTKSFLPFKNKTTPRLIGLKSFISNQNLNLLKHCFIYFTNLRQTKTQIFINWLIQWKPIITLISKQKKATLKKFAVNINKTALNKTALNKTLLNKKYCKIKINYGKLTKKRLSQQSTLKKYAALIYSKIKNVSVFKQTYSFIKHQVMLKPFVCFGLPFNYQLPFDSQYQKTLTNLIKNSCFSGSETKNVLKSLILANQTQNFQILKRWYPTRLGEPALSSLANMFAKTKVVVSTKQGELISVSNDSMHTSLIPQWYNQPILMHSRKVKAYQTKSQMNYDLQQVAECAYLTNEDLQSYMLPNFWSISFCHSHPSNANKNKIPCGSVGQYLPVGVAFFKQAGFSESGQVLYLNKRKVVIRRAKSFLLTTGATLQLPYGQFIAKNSPLIKLSYKQILADDIIQGIPKIDRIFEARGIQPGITLAKLLKQQFKTSCALYLNQADPDFSASATKITIEFIQHYTLDAIQNVYQSQGVVISDKHLEIIIKQMTSKVLITDPKNSGFLKGDLVDFQWVNQANALAKPEHRIQYEPIILGITQSSLQTDGFISAASFQETINVLTKAAYFRTTDFLTGLKENVILGHLIPVGTGMRF
jgi:hypothetical protein